MFNFVEWLLLGKKEENIEVASTDTEVDPNAIDIDVPRVHVRMPVVRAFLLNI